MNKLVSDEWIESNLDRFGCVIISICRIPKNHKIIVEGFLKKRLVLSWWKQFFGKIPVSNNQQSFKIIGCTLNWMNVDTDQLLEWDLSCKIDDAIERFENYQLLNNVEEQTKAAVPSLPHDL